VIPTITGHDQQIEIHGVSAAIAAVSPWIYSILVDLRCYFDPPTPMRRNPMRGGGSRGIGDQTDTLTP
jgi:hypothetical protein